MARLVDLAAHLRRTNAAKWPFSRAEWHVAVTAVLVGRALERIAAKMRQAAVVLKLCTS